MSCDQCQKAAACADWPLFTAKCEGCSIRSLASGFAYWQSGREGKLTPVYTDALRKLFGDEWKAAHERVKAEAKRIQEARALL